MPATDDYYTCASGGSIEAGIAAPAGLPAWVAPTGTIADLSLNTLASVAAPSTNVPAVWGAWSGVAWAPWWGAYGSIVATGGGHADRQYNEVWRLDLETRLFSQIKSSASYYIKSDSYVADPTTGWLWSNATDGDTSVQIGEPFSGHFYSHLMALPSSALPSLDATNGVLYTAARIAMGEGGQRGTQQSHALRLGLDTEWTAVSTPGVDGPGYGGACYDQTRSRVWYVNYLNDGAGVFSWRDLSDGTYGSVTATGTAWVNYYRILEWHEAEGLLMAARVVAGQNVLGIYDPATNTIYQPAVSGTAPTATDGAFAWSAVWGAWAYLPKEGGSTVYFLKQPAGDPRTGTWAWSSQTLTGSATAAATGGSAPGYNRLRHAAALGDVLVWAADVNYPAQQLSVSAP